MEKKSIILFTILFLFCSIQQTICGVQLSFYNKHLSKLSSALEVKEKPDGSFGIFAKKSISSGDTIIKLPKEYVYCGLDDYPRSYFFYEFINKDSTDNLVGRILYEKTFKAQDFFNQYYNELFVDKEIIQNAAPFWTEEENEEYTQRLGFDIDNQFNRKLLDKKILTIIERNIKYLNDYEPKFPEDMITIENLNKAYALIINRAISFSNFEWKKLNSIGDDYKRIQTKYAYESTIDFKSNFPSVVFLPFIDMIQTKIPSLKTQYNITEYFDVSEPIILRYLSDLGCNYSKEINYEILEIDPNDFVNNRMMDMLYSESPQSDQIGLHIRVEPGYLKLLSNKRYAKGEEIIYERGLVTNNEYLIGLGRIKIPNNIDEFTIQLEYNNSKLQEICTKTYCGVPDFEHMDYKFYSYQINHKFLNYLRFKVELDVDENSFDEQTSMRIYRRNKFNNPYKELLVWYRYLQHIDIRQNFKTSLRQDRIDLKKIKKNNLKKQMILYGMQQKKLIYKHLNCALRMWQKTMMNDILMSYQKDYVLKLISGKAQSGKLMFMHGFQE